MKFTSSVTHYTGHLADVAVSYGHYRFLVLELEAEMGQTDRQTDRQDAVRNAAS